jgi:asparagine synthase (glutamine-hydrolysing)
MNDTLAHRGPDDEGFLFTREVGLAMRRLSIIDVAGGRQPVHNEDGTVTVVLNGEIYNYRDLGAGLRARGHGFRSASDTEVIAHLYEERGIACVDELRGMFAFALWDARTDTLVIARDRLGVKPLYYWTNARRLVFASELKALLVDPEVPRDVDVDSLSTYLRYGYVPDPRTILHGVRKLPPAHVLVVRQGRLDVRRYWDVGAFFARPAARTTEADGEAELEERLREAVRLRLISDVPVGAFLSGGLDSSMVVALMARAADRPVKTFSIGFADEHLNELPYARRVARSLGTEHQELVLEPGSVDILNRIAWHFDEPFGDPSALPTYHVSRLASESVKVVLSGDGGDESFAGYDRYREHVSRDWVEVIPPGIRRRTLGALSRALPERAPGRRLLHNLSLARGERYLDSVTYFSRHAQRALLSDDVWAQLGGGRDLGDAAHTLSGPEPAQSLDLVQAIDFRTYLPGDILVKVDRMSMAHSLEAREPLLDHRLVEFMASLPPGLKVRHGEGKYLFKKLARRYLPPEIVDRPKQGFAVPLHQWFREALKDFLIEVLLDRSTLQRGYFDPRALRAFVDDHRARDRATHLWILVMLELWHRMVLGH